jgi:hypothetical protein
MNNMALVSFLTSHKKLEPFLHSTGLASKKLNMNTEKIDGVLNVV